MMAVLSAVRVGVRPLEVNFRILANARTKFSEI
jgi:hypothetical protein